MSSKSGFGNAILLVTISTASLIAIVKSSLALSLGLVGALSVVRFRTAVKEPYNLAFILFAICAGISIEFVPKVNVPLVTAPPVVDELNSNVVELVTEETVAPAGIPVPVTVIPATNLEVESIVMVGSLL